MQRRIVYIPARGLGESGYWNGFEDVPQIDANKPLREQLTRAQIVELLTGLWTTYGLRPDPAGVNFWADDVMSSGKTANNMRAAITDSNEYKANQAAGRTLKRFYRDVNSSDNTWNLATGEAYGNFAAFVAAGGKVGEWETGSGAPSAGLVAQYRAQNPSASTSTGGGTTTTTTGGGSTSTGLGSLSGLWQSLTSNPLYLIGGGVGLLLLLGGGKKK